MIQQQIGWAPASRAKPNSII